MCRSKSGKSSDSQETRPGSKGRKKGRKVHAMNHQSLDEFDELLVKIDTGAQGNILIWHVFKSICPKPVPGTLRPSKVILTAYNGAWIPQRGTLQLLCKHGKSSWLKEEFYVADLWSCHPWTPQLSAPQDGDTPLCHTQNAR